MAAPLLPVLLGRARFGVPVRFYRAAPLRRRTGPAPADPEDLRALSRRFGRLGEASGVPVWRLWPSPERLRELEEEEREWDPPLREVEAAVERREREEARKREERARAVSLSLASMPERIRAWREEREAARERARREAERRQNLLAQAGLSGTAPPRPGTPLSRGTPKTQEVLQELEKQQRKEEKRRRRQEREEELRRAVAAAEAAAASRAPPGAPQDPPPSQGDPETNRGTP